jgi:alkylation response protein AidB-like acyl-CoA dehydrogenase
VDFDLTDDQLELQRVVRDVAERECPPAVVRQVVEKGEDVPGLWATYVQLDWPSLTVPEADGGMGFTAVELAIVLDELGRVADPSPFLATTSQYVPLVREALPPTARRQLLGAVCRGTIGAAAFDAADVRAEPDGDGWRLTGTARHVVDGDRAEALAVVATTPGGVGAFALPATDATARRTPAIDGSFHVADVELDGVLVPAERAATGTGTEGMVARAREEALVGMAAATVGAAQRTFEIALGHIKDRHQFGVPIGSFQALKHMAVDVYVAIERARALCQFAGLLIAEDDPRRAVTASMAKAAAGDAQRIAVRHGIQFFGGLGYTWENDLQLYVRRAKVGELLLGGTHEHRAIVARATLAGTATAAAVDTSRQEAGR